MRWTTPLLALVAALAPAGGELQYRVEKVTPRVKIIRGQEQQLAVGGEALSPGDELSTSWRGRATVAVLAQAARFEIGPSSHVKLAAGQPGVLLRLEGGSLRAIFDALVGSNEDRIVATPGALLAVRGTRYGVRVLADGQAVLAVFAGAVEVLPSDPSLPPTTVGAGELCHFGPRRAPHRLRFPPGLEERGWERHGAFNPKDEAASHGGGPTPAPGGPSRGTRRSGGRN